MSITIGLLVFISIAAIIVSPFANKFNVETNETGMKFILQFTRFLFVLYVIGIGVFCYDLIIGLEI